jgi:thiol-disulfide isomerase/thioredoxin
LEDSTYEHVLEQEQDWFIDFYSSTCDFCVRFEPVFAETAQAATQLTVRLARADCAHQTILCERFHIRTIPTLLFIRGESKRQFYGIKDKEHMLRFLSEMTGPSVIETHQYSNLMASRHLKPHFAFIGSRDDQSFSIYSSIAHEFQGAARFFAIAPELSPAALQFYGVLIKERPHVLYLVDGTGVEDFDALFSITRLRRWVSQRAFILFPQLSSEVFDEVIHSRDFSVIAITHPVKTQESIVMLENMEKIAKVFREVARFCYLPNGSFPAVIVAAGIDVSRIDSFPMYLVRKRNDDFFYGPSAYDIDTLFDFVYNVTHGRTHPSTHASLSKMLDSYLLVVSENMSVCFSVCVLCVDVV